MTLRRLGTKDLYKHERIMCVLWVFSRLKLKHCRADAQIETFKQARLALQAIPMILPDSDHQPKSAAAKRCHLYELPFERLDDRGLQCI